MQLKVGVVLVRSTEVKVESPPLINESALLNTRGLNRLVKQIAIQKLVNSTSTDIIDNEENKFSYKTLVAFLIKCLPGMVCSA